VFERARRLAVYGNKGKADMLLVSSLLVSLFVGGLLISGLRATAASLADPYVAANLSTLTVGRDPNRSAYLRAQREYLATGETTTYFSGNERVRYQPTEFDIRSRERIASDIAVRTKAMDIRLAFAGIWFFGPLTAAIVGFLLGRNEFRQLSEKHGFERLATHKTFADVDGLINTLRAACEDPELFRTLDLILTQPDHARKAMLRELITEMRAKQAPADLLDAFICLMDDQAAEKAYTVIYKCERPAIRLAVGAN
jgi:hypothetical protein